MTREEYEHLLKSDYWKGYSYSIIKERNFTCEDCGRRFPNERNKLQVHHLVYRDVKPWSYRPEELIVLCEDCHKRRHGLAASPQPLPQTPADNYNKSYSYSHGDYKDEKNIFSGFKLSSLYPIWRFLWRFSKRHKKLVFWSIFVLFIMLIGMCNGSEQTTSMESEDTESVSNVSSHDSKPVSSSSRTSQKAVTKETEDVDNTMDVSDISQEGVVDVDEVSPDEATENEMVETPEPVIVEEVTETPTREETTSDILERIHHANVVEQAKRAGVSTEGSTSDILERINRKNLERFGY